MRRSGAILAQRCPRCLRGRVFGGLVRMNTACPSCELSFEREQGYFLGAMYFSYGLGLLAIGAPVTWLIVERAPRWVVVGVAAGLLLLLAPLLFRYSRVLWLHFDQQFDPR
jgi:uncharacterized protein (DUF983 family)